MIELKQFHTEARRSINAPPVVKKITAMTAEFPFSNAMSEITHRIYKSEFMGGKHSEDLALHIASLNDFMEYYNYNRYLFVYMENTYANRRG